MLHSFGNGADGTFPEGGLVFDGAGNLYGATYNGGVNNTGAVFKMTPMQGGGWSETILHNFGPLFGGRWQFSIRQPDPGQCGQPLRHDKRRRRPLQRGNGI